MKLLVIGCGQCGGRIADEFALMSKKAHVQGGLDILTNVLAVNTDVADLSAWLMLNPTSSTASSSATRKPAATAWAR